MEGTGIGEVKFDESILTTCTVPLQTALRGEMDFEMADSCAGSGAFVLQCRALHLERYARLIREQFNNYEPYGVEVEAGHWPLSRVSSTQERGQRGRTWPGTEKRCSLCDTQHESLLADPLELAVSVKSVHLVRSEAREPISPTCRYFECGVAVVA